MHKPLFSLAISTALAISTVLGNLSASYAGNCESNLQPAYDCTATFENGSSLQYCVVAYNFVPGDGHFYLDAGGVPNYCTCGAKGAQFGQGKDFLCDQWTDGTAVTVGKITGNKIKGQAYDSDTASRALLTCEAVAVCP
jgi:hypothetical protein